MDTVEKVFDDDNTLMCIIIRPEYSIKSGINFFTSADSSFQVGFMRHDKDDVILPHIHNEAPREILLTQEVLFVRSGKMRMDIFTSKGDYLKSFLITSGTAILLVKGGHAFKMIEPTEIIEVKQGPYVADVDKVRFTPISDDMVKFE